MIKREVKRNEKLFISSYRRIVCENQGSWTTVPEETWSRNPICTRENLQQGGWAKRNRLNNGDYQTAERGQH